jgi:hypothetical protein
VQWQPQVNRHRAVVVISACALLASVPRPAAAKDGDGNVLTVIEESVRLGRISPDAAEFYRLAAVRAPGRLPAELRGLAAPHRSGRGCHTPLLQRAWRALPTMTEPWRSQLRDLLHPDDLANFVEATAPFPVRVSYGRPDLAAKAQVVLEATLASYVTQVEGFGFWPPGIEAGTERYRIYLDDALGAAGYTAPYMDDERTPHADALSYIVVESSLTDNDLRTTVAHEFNHACQLAMDANEVTAFMENTATWIEDRTFPEISTMSYMFRYFQDQPYRPLEFMQSGDSDGYEYGGALFVLYLESQFGGLDPAFARGIWEGTVQAGTQNEPDYQDVIDHQLAQQGGLTEAVLGFAQARFFVGRDDDRQHLDGAASWAGAEVARTATFGIDDLPRRAERPADPATRPQPNGCNYVVLDVTRTPEFPLRFSFAGAPERRWNADLLQIAPPAPTTFVRLPLDATAAGSAVVDAAGLERLVLVICQLGDAGYDPDSRSWVAADYTFAIEYAVPPPVVTAVSPGQLARGSHDSLLTVIGTGFVAHQELKVSTAVAGVTLELAKVVSPSELQVTAFASPTAPLGPFDIVVTNPGGAEGVGAGLLTIVAAVPPTDGEPRSGGGGCSLSAAPRGRLLFSLLALGLCLRRAAVTRARRPR